MGRSRTPQANLESSEQLPEDPAISPEAVATVAALLVAGAAPGAIASALLLLLPGGLVARFPEAAAQSALGAANLLDRGRGRGGDEAAYTALYAINAARRLFRGREDFSAALNRERGYLRQHREARQRRKGSRGVTEAMVARWGPVLSWQHGVARTPMEPRPAHVAANGKNVDVSRGIPVVLGAHPGELAGCTCAWGPPVEGAELIQ